MIKADFAFGSRVRPSPFFEATLRWGASAFTVYNHTLMPIVYESPERDYWHLVNAVTLWDVTGQKQIQITGRDAFAFAQRLTSRDLSGCVPGRCRYVLLTDDNGGVLNDPVLLRLAEDKIWLSLADSDMLWWCRAVAAREGYKAEIVIPDVSPLQLQGPRAAEVAVALFGDWVGELGYFHMREFEHDGIPLALSRTGWSGEIGYEIYLRDGEQGDRLWERIMEAGAPFGIRPAAPSTMRRLEAGMLSYGADANGDDTPFHLGMERFVDLDGGIDFIGKNALLAVRRAGVSRRLVGVMLDGEPLTTPQIRWWDATDKSGARIGKVRSSAHSPALRRNIGLAMVNKPHDAPGACFAVKTERGERLAATVAPLPFVAGKAVG